MKKYCITIRTKYGSLIVDGGEDETEPKAIKIAEELIEQELGCIKIDEVYCY